MGRVVLPKGATYHFSPQKKFAEIVLFTHHFAGSQYNLRRHVRLVTQLGFDAITFDFSWHNYVLPKTTGIGKTLKKTWSHEVEEIVESLPPETQLITYSFSGPSASVIEMVVRRQKEGLKNIKAMIFDSGPFMDPWVCTDNLLKVYYGVKNPLKRRIYLTAMMSAWGLDHTRTLDKNMNEIDKNLPLLSIRAEKDELVPAEQINAVFVNRDLKNLQILLLKDCRHLVGLKDFEPLYRPVLEQFLLAHSTPLK